MNTLNLKKIIIPVLIAIFAVAPVAALATSPMKHLPEMQTLVLLRADGSALVRGAEVTAVADDTVTAQTSHDGVVLTWTIDIDSDTELVTNKGGDFDLSDIDDGDTVSFSGELTSAFRIEANVLKEWKYDSDDGNDNVDRPSKDERKEIQADFRAQMRGWFDKHLNFGFWKK